MVSTRPDPTFHLRTLLVLGRVSNLPTVWSNCLAGWWLSGGGGTARFLTLCAGATFLYLGGMYFNDAFDADFDRAHRRDRPIPAGLVRPGTVWQLGVLWFALGLLLLACLSATTAALAGMLTALIVLYDAVHKVVVFAPVLMACCRTLLYLVAGAATVTGLSGLAIWSGLAMGGYILGLSQFARRETSAAPLRWWPVGFLGVPIVLALIVNGGTYFQPGLWLIFLLILWLVRCLRPAFRHPGLHTQEAVAGLLAGIVWVDLLALAGESVTIVMVFATLFLMTRLLQRVIPAT